MITMDDFLLGISLFSTLFLAITFLQLIRNRFDFKRVRLSNSTTQSTDSNSDLKISVCIPMRNEQNNAHRVITALKEQTDKNFKLLILDDQSEDATRSEIDKTISNFHSPVQVITGQPKPVDWLGKPWACHQLSKKADGDILLYLDADTTPYPHFISTIRNLFTDTDTDCITIWPEQELTGFWQNQVLPLVYYALLTLLPFRYIRRKPYWMPTTLYEHFKHRFAAANGQCIAFKTSAYQKIGGHKSVKDQVVEDVALARNIRRNGLQLMMYPGTELIRCKMYSTHSEMKLGFKKNFLAGFDDQILLFIGMGLLHLVVFLLPFGLTFIALLNANTILLYVSVLNICVIFLSRLFVNHWFQWPILGAFFHPVGVLWFQWLSLLILWDRIRGRKVNWKGRPVS